MIAPTTISTTAQPEESKQPDKAARKRQGYVFSTDDDEVEQIPAAKPRPRGGMVFSTDDPVEERKGPPPKATTVINTFEEGKAPPVELTSTLAGTNNAANSHLPPEEKHLRIAKQIQ